MPLCSVCKKRQAMVMIADAANPGKTKGYCLTCAHKLGIPNVENVLNNLGVDIDAMEKMEDQMYEIMQNPGEPGGEMLKNVFDSIFSSSDEHDHGDDDDDDDEYDGEDEIEDEDDYDGEDELPEPDEGITTRHELSMIIPMTNEALSALTEKSDDESDDDDEKKDGDKDKGKNDRKNKNRNRGSLSFSFPNLFGNSFEMGGAPTIGGAPRHRGGKKKKGRYLGEYCDNLTEKARRGEIDPVIGRDKEIDRVIQILSRKNKNNPCLIGEPGVGKTAIAEGLALRIADDRIPQRLCKAEVYRLDLTALVAGTQFRGQFESRMKGLIDEIKNDKNVILFIDEIHSIVGAGDAEGSMNAANILKPALSRGEIRVIGATTFNEYRKYIEKDAALERRFQPVSVNEPNVEETVEILRGIKQYYEDYHHIHIDDKLLYRTVVLSERYINDRFLPDKAIDLLDEACSRASLNNKAMEEYEKLKVERDEFQREYDSMEGQLPENPDLSDGYYASIANLRTSALNIQAEMDKLWPEANSVQVTEADLAQVIELWTGIQASRVEESEFRKLSGLNETLDRHIVGQHEATQLVSAAIRRNRAQISPRRRPPSFIFVGPTGVGKTELVKVLARELFDSPDTMIRMDMSEYMEKHSVSKLIGAPPGYVGYDEAGQLTEKVRRKPYSVLLFDEIEKAHPDVMNILLQILDEGRINDSQGRSVSFENTVIIMTSNAGSNKQGGSLGFGKSSDDISKEKAMSSLREFLRPEFLARVDEIVVFRQLDEEDFKQIARILLDEYVKSMEERGVKLNIDESAVELLAGKSIGGSASARDLRNMIRREVEDRLASIVIQSSGELPDEITVTTKSGEGGSEIVVE